MAPPAPDPTTITSHVLLLGHHAAGVTASVAAGRAGGPAVALARMSAAARSAPATRSTAAFRPSRARPPVGVDAARRRTSARRLGSRRASVRPVVARAKALAAATPAASPPRV